jgi:hypothetical protein
MTELTQLALDILQHGPPVYLEDARNSAPLGNSVIGAVLWLTTGTPRWATEEAVCQALQVSMEPRQ